MLINFPYSSRHFPSGKVTKQPVEQFTFHSKRTTNQMKSLSVSKVGGVDDIPLLDTLSCTGSFLTESRTFCKRFRRNASSWFVSPNLTYLPGQIISASSIVVRTRCTSAVAKSLPTEIQREVVLGTGLIFHVSPK